MSGARWAGPSGGIGPAGPRSSSPACGRAFFGASSALLAGVLTRCPATSAMSASRAMEATAQGSAAAPPRRSTGLPRAAPTAVPQRWQNLAPAESADPHAAHTAPSRGTPQLAQNRPLAAAPQLGQEVDVLGA